MLSKLSKKQMKATKIARFSVTFNAKFQLSAFSVK